MLAARYVRPLIVSLLLAATYHLLGSPQAAVAVPPITISNLQCISSDGHFWCEAHVNGGTGEYHYTWQVIRYAQLTSDPGAPSATGVCQLGKTAQIGLIVNDTAGSGSSASTQFTCNATVE